MTRKTGNYDEYHLEWLKDPENVSAFLNAVIEDNDREAFLLALREVAQAQGGMTAGTAVTVEPDMQAHGSA